MTAPPRADGRTVLGLMALVILLFRPWVADGLPLFGSDLVLFFYPLLTAIRDSLAAGHFPWWTDRVFAGMPLAADPQASVFYPPAWALFTGPFERLMAPYLAVHLLTLGVGASVAFARLGASRLGAFLGGAALMLGTTLPGRLVAGHLTYLQAAAWIPWAYAALLGHLATGERRRLAAVAAFLGLSLLGGFPQITFYGILWLLWTALSSPRPGVPSVVRAFGGTLLAVLLAFGVAGAVIVPGWEMSRLSVRIAGMSDLFRLSDSLPFRHLATFFLPGLFGGDPVQYAAGESYRWWEFTAYNGLLPWLALPIAGAALRRHPAFLHVAIPVPATILLALGANTPVYPLIMRLPGFSLFRIPAQIVFLTAVALAGITALAVTTLQFLPARRWRLTVPAVCGLLLSCAALGARFFPEKAASMLRHLAGGVGATGGTAEGGALPGAALLPLVTGAVLCLAYAAAVRLHRGRMALGPVVLAAVVLIDLYLPCRNLIGYFPPDRLYGSAALLSELPPSAEPQRTLPLAGLLRANEPLRFGWQGIGGYNPLIPAGTARLLSAMEGFPWPTPSIGYERFSHPLSPIAALLNCRYVVSPTPLEGPAWQPIVPSAHPDGGTRYVYRREGTLPRATVYPSVTPLPDRALDGRIRTIDPWRELLVDSRIDLPDVATDLPVRAARYLPQGPARATVVDDTGAGGYLLLSQTWHPGWTASFDGGGLLVLPADIGLALVPLPKGCRRLELAYRPASHRAGLALSAASLLALCLLLWGGCRRRP